MENLSNIIPKLFPAASAEYRLDQFSVHKIDRVVEALILPAFDTIETDIDKLVANVRRRIYTKSVILTISEVGRWFYFTAAVNKFNCVVLSAEYEETTGAYSAKTKYEIARKVFDYRKGERIKDEDILKFFTKTFADKCELYQKIDEEKNRWQRENEMLKIERVRSEYLRLRKENDETDEELSVNSLYERGCKNFCVIQNL